MTSIPHPPSSRTQTPQSGAGKRLPLFNSIGSRLFISVLGGAAIGLGAMGIFFYSTLKQQAEIKIQQTLQTEVNSIESQFTPVQQSMRDLTGSVLLLHGLGIKDSQVYKQAVFQSFLKRPKLAMASGFGQMPRAIVPDRQWYYPYFYLDQKAEGQIGERLPAPNNNIFYSELFRDDNYPIREYFTLPTRTRKEVWIEPYLWYGVTMTTFMNPIIDQQGELLGAAGMDVNVTDLSKSILPTVFDKQGYFVVVSKGGTLVHYPPDPQQAIKLAKYAQVPELQKIWPQIQRQSSGIIQAGDKFWAFRRIPSADWVMLAAVPQSAVFRPVLITVVGSTLGVAALLGVIVFLFVRRLNQRLQPILDECNKLAEADQETLAKIQQEDEIGRLSLSLFNLLDQLGSKEENLRQEITRSEHLAQEQQRLTEKQQESEALQVDVGHLLDVVSAVEEGDLTVEAEVSDRATGLIADTLNRLIEQLGVTLTQVFKAAQQVSEGSANLEELAKIVAANAEQQAQEVTNVLERTEEVEASAESSSQQVALSNQALLNVSAVVQEGQSSIETMNQGINVLQQGTDRIVQRMKTLGEFVGLADQFVQEQNQIASLTQVLALNATLVAARAAEQRDPRQFLVVAREFEAIAAQVSGLAQQTNDGLGALQQRTTQIHTVVSAIDSEVQSLGSLVKSFTEGVAQSNQVFSSVQTTTDDVVQAGQAVAQSNQQIGQAAQATATAMRGIADLAERTAQLTQATQSQSEQMELLSKQLLKSIQFFRLPGMAQPTQNLDSAPWVDLSADPGQVTLETASSETKPEPSLDALFN